MSTYADFGKYLTQQRELRGLSRAEVAAATKISAMLVEALEEGLPEKLPERVFVHNLIKSYAQAVGLSADEAVTRWHEIPGVAPEPAATPQMLEAARRKKALVVVGVLLGLSAAAYLVAVAMGVLPSPFAS